MLISLRSTLTTWHVLALGIGILISAPFFGWGFGWDKAGSLGFLLVCFFVTLMYITFVNSLLELATAIPLAAGPFVYAQRALGNHFAFVAGIATLVEFLFAPPAVAMAISAYFHIQFSNLDPQMCALLVYLVFVSINLLGAKIALMVEMVIALLVVLELLIFVGMVAPSFSFSTLVDHGWAGKDVLTLSTITPLFAAIPFAIWLYLGIESMVMLVEEVKTPTMMLAKSMKITLYTLMVLSFLVMIVTGGLPGWSQFAATNDPLPQAIKLVVGANNIWFHLVVAMGLAGLLAAFHGLVYVSSRQIYGLSRIGFLPRSLGVVNKKFGTPHIAILASSLPGVFAIMCNDLSLDGQSLAASFISLSVLGAIIAYMTSMISLMVLRVKEPDLYRPYRVPFYPWFPIFALVSSTFSLGAVIYSNLKMTFTFFGIMAVIYFIFSILEHHSNQQD